MPPKENFTLWPFKKAVVFIELLLFELLLLLLLFIVPKEEVKFIIFWFVFCDLLFPSKLVGKAEKKKRKKKREKKNRRKEKNVCEKKNEITIWIKWGGEKNYEIVKKNEKNYGTIFSNRTKSKIKYCHNDIFHFIQKI